MPNLSNNKKITILFERKDSRIAICCNGYFLTIYKFVIPMCVFF